MQIYLLMPLFLSWLTFSAFASAPPKTTDVLFILYDAGETKALIPVMIELENAKIPYMAIVMGTARSLMTDKDHVIDIAQCGVKADIDQKTWPREKQLDSDDLSKVQKCVQSRMVITGTASEIQLQAANGAKRDKKLVMAFYDALMPIAKDSLASKFDRDSISLLVASDDIAHSVHEKAVTIVGHPGCDDFATPGTLLELADLKNRLHFLKEEQPTVLFVGGYGDGYEDVFNHFVRSTKSLHGYNLLVSLHPKVDGSLEQSIIKSLDAKDIYILPKPGCSPDAVNTKEAVWVADVIVTQGSSVGVQALVLGKTVVYLEAFLKLFQ